jgi:hypothetical protein
MFKISMININVNLMKGQYNEQLQQKKQRRFADNSERRLLRHLICGKGYGVLLNLN